MLLVEWASGQDRPFAWLTLDDLDNDPNVFLSYLALAFDRVTPVDPSIRRALTAAGQRVLGTAVPRLAGELHRWSRPGILVIDDAHRLVDRTCLDALSELLDHLPPGFQVAVAARLEPGLPFARHRARGQLLELGATSLAFDEQETDALALGVGRRLTPTEVRRLTDRTEGWAAGIYLATLARDPGDEAIRPVGDVSGRDGFIADYLREELLRGIADHDLAFLTRTSVLETVEPATAEAVTGMPGAAGRLRSLARSNLLIGTVSSQPAAYRYHHLLREFLQEELERREPGAAGGLHARASAWYLDAGRIELGVDHALLSGDVDAAARLVGRTGLATFYGGRGHTLDRWLQRFDEDVLGRHPSLALLAGWINLLYGRVELADRMLDIAERSSPRVPPGDGSASLESGRSMLRAVMCRRGVEDALANARVAVAAEASGSPWRATALWLLGSTLLLSGDVTAADDAFAMAEGAAEGAGATAMVALAKRASIAGQRGDWKLAALLVTRSEAVLERAAFGEIVAALMTHVVAARVAAALGDRDRAREYLVRAQQVRPLASTAAPWFSVDALLELARAYLAMSDPAGARSVLREAEDIARQRPGLGVLVAELGEMRRRLADATSTLAGSSSLTAAELRLLPILSTYLSFQDIAERLGISRNTVKTQALSIYGKLQASSRGEAVERAVELGLLEPFPGLVLTRDARQR
jgi:LuxR family maltose regulon positive regulatory protein